MGPTVYFVDLTPGVKRPVVRSCAREVARMGRENRDHYNLARVVPEDYGNRYWVRAWTEWDALEAAKRLAG